MVDEAGRYCEFCGETDAWLEDGAWLCVECGLDLEDY